MKKSYLWPMVKWLHKMLHGRPDYASFEMSVVLIAGFLRFRQTTTFWKWDLRENLSQSAEFFFSWKEFDLSEKIVRSSLFSNEESWMIHIIHNLHWCVILLIHNLGYEWKKILKNWKTDQGVLPDQNIYISSRNVYFTLWMIPAIV